MRASHEITTLEEFRGVTSQSVGVVVVTDTPTSVTRAHATTCQFVTDDNFTTKVIDGQGKNGGYFFFPRFADAAQETGAVRCASCGGG